MKIRRAILILDIALRTADNTLQQSRKVVRYHSYLFGFPSQTELEFDLQQYIDAIKDHKQRVEMLLDSANSIKLIVSDEITLVVFKCFTLHLYTQMTLLVLATSEDRSFPRNSDFSTC